MITINKNHPDRDSILKKNRAALSMNKKEKSKDVDNDNTKKTDDDEKLNIK